MDPQLQAQVGQDNRDVAVAIHRGDGHDVFQTVYSFLSSPRVTTVLKWTVVSGISVGVCAVVVHYYIQHQRRALSDALKSSIDALKNTMDTENVALIRTVEMQNSIIQAEHDTISTLCQSMKEKVASESENIKRLLETIQKLTEQNATVIKQLAQHQRLSSDAIKVAEKLTEESDSATKTVSWLFGKGVGILKYYTGWP